MAKQRGEPSLANALGVSETHVTTIQFAKADPRALEQERKLLATGALTVEDADINVTAFEALGKGHVIRPPFDFMMLSWLVQQNNTLLQCVQAMEVNVDGTGYEIERADGEKMTDADKAKVKEIKAFFDQPYPGESIVTQRRRMRQSMESTGNGYYEAIRSQDGTLTFIRPLDSKLMRLCKLGDPQPVTKTMKRGNREVTLKVLERPRKYAMTIGKELVYFKEAGLKDLFLNRKTGAWTTSSNGADEATEVIHLRVFPDVATMYGVPRWINQLPSVLGSRKAEEFNLEFFNAGGLPPAMVLVQGGALSAASRKALTDYLSGKAKYKQRAVLAEIFPAGGSLDGGGGGSVRVTVERFGDERQKDSMFQTYDKNCGEHVRQAFRLPPLFVGQSQDQNFATAYASYLVAEAQVFKPEREEFDEVINVRVMAELWPDYVFRSLPMSINDVTNQLKALTLAKDMADPDKFIEQLNEVGSLTLTLREGYTEEQQQRLASELASAALGVNPGDDEEGADDEEGEDGKPVARKGKVPASGSGLKVEKVVVSKGGKIANLADEVLIELARDWADYSAARVEFEPHTVSAMETLIKTLDRPTRKLFNAHVADLIASPKHDPSGTASLLDCANEALGKPHPEGCDCGQH